MRPEWRTDTVVGLCAAIRETQDFSAMPVLADALQDAGCPEDEELLKRLRRGPTIYSVDAPLVASIWSEEGEKAVEWLTEFEGSHDCPRFGTLFAAATGHHEENDEGDEYGYSKHESWDGVAYLHFNGTDAHGEIPAEFWEHVQLVSGKTIPAGERAARFSCSC